MLCKGRYRLEEVVGRGGMAAVWRATDLQLERTVAIKVISDALAGDPVFVARFAREARLAAGVNHPNLVKLFDFSADEERPFLVMEYIPGGTLADARDRVDPVALARDLLEAVAHIHGAGILHRDIKPANVLLGADNAPRLTDFGVARGEEQTGLTLTGQVLGTLRFIAPEVAAGRPASARSDLYSLGVLLREVAGEVPPQALAGLLPRLTAADPELRPGSAAEALAELQPTRPLTATMPLIAAAPRARGASRTPPVRRIRIGRRRLAALAALAVATVAVIAIAAGGGNDLNRATRAARTQAAATRVRPAAPDAPLDQQIGALERIVRSAQRKP